MCHKELFSETSWLITKNLEHSGQFATVFKCNHLFLWKEHLIRKGENVKISGRTYLCFLFEEFYLGSFLFYQILFFIFEASIFICCLSHVGESLPKGL